jgi:hypothetical protein
LLDLGAKCHPHRTGQYRADLPHSAHTLAYAYPYVHAFLYTHSYTYSYSHAVTYAYPYTHINIFWANSYTDKYAYGYIYTHLDPFADVHNYNYAHIYIHFDTLIYSYPYVHALLYAHIDTYADDHAVAGRGQTTPIPVINLNPSLRAFFAKQSHEIFFVFEPFMRLLRRERHPPRNDGQNL